VKTEKTVKPGDPVYVTKYVGVVNEYICVSLRDQYVRVQGNERLSFGSKDWFADRPSAISDAKSRVAKKISSLRKQIAALEKLDIT
jgi:hypothetical protein